jgi:hypothetical protein
MSIGPGLLSERQTRTQNGKVVKQPPGSSGDRAQISPRLQRSAVREPLIFLAFLALTAAMTWPWVLHLSDGVPDAGDTYSHAYFLWWGYYQTLHEPLNLFHATVFYPYKYTLAFGESDYGISLIFFPLFAIGLRPLTIYSVAALTSFAFSGYGAFRLARTLSGSNVVAWTAGVIFAFVPFRFQHLNHLPELFAGWIPLVFEALLLFAREHSWKRAGWLALTFVMNALTCLTWFVLVLIPLGLSGILLLTRNRTWRSAAVWLRLGAACLMASILLLPFLLPYVYVARTFGFVRDASEVQTYSAVPINWLAIANNRLWQGLGAAGARSEMALFPGFLPLLLALAALLLGAGSVSDMADSTRSFLRKITLVALDSIAIGSGIVAMLAIGYDRFTLRLYGMTLLSAQSPARALVIAVLALSFRFTIALPQAVRNSAKKLIQLFERKTSDSLSRSADSELLLHGLLWSCVGFMGSFGLNFVFHRVLYNYIPLFRGLRVASRWAMICYVGLALLAGLGAKRLAGSLKQYWPRPGIALTATILLVAILFEQRAAPLPLIKSEPEPDELTLYLKNTNMAGGIVELPAGYPSTRYMLRAADHGRPLVTALDSFVPPIAAEIESMSSSAPIPDRFLDLLEQIPASYLTVHNALATPEQRLEIDKFLDRAIATGRLRFIRSFASQMRYGIRERNDLYAVIRTEPEARSEEPRPPPFVREASQPALIADFEEKSFFIYRLYRASYARLPLFAEFVPDAQNLTRDPNSTVAEWEKKKVAFVETWINRPQFRSRFDGLSDEQYCDTLLAQTGLTVSDATRHQMLRELSNRTTTRAAVLMKLADDGAFAARERNTAFVLMHYFAYLRRDPELGGLYFWLDYLKRSPDYRNLTELFAASSERLDQPLP